VYPKVELAWFGEIFGLAFVCVACGQKIVEESCDRSRHDPHQPFNAGSPETAFPDIAQRTKMKIAKATKGRELVSQGFRTP